MSDIKEAKKGLLNALANKIINPCYRSYWDNLIEASYLQEDAFRPYYVLMLTDLLNTSFPMNSVYRLISNIKNISKHELYDILYHVSNLCDRGAEYFERHRLQDKTAVLTKEYYIHEDDSDVLYAYFVVKSHLDNEPFMVNDIVRIMKGFPEIGEKYRDVLYISKSEYCTRLKERVQKLISLFPNDVIAVNVYLSEKEFPELIEYTSFKEMPDALRTKVKFALQRDIDLYRKNGFVSINSYVGYECSEAMIYNNTVGKSVKARMDSFADVHKQNA